MFACIAENQDIGNAIVGSETNGHGVRRAEDQTAEQVPVAGAAANATRNTVRRVEFLDEEYEVFDLTQFGAYGSDDAWFQHGNLFMVSEQEHPKQLHQPCMCFDMTYSDSDLYWTEPDSHSPCSHILDGGMDDLSDSVSDYSEDFPCIRAVKKVNTAMPTLANVILDSGADASILPVHMAQVGMPARSSAANQRFHNAQGHDEGARPACGLGFWKHYHQRGISGGPGFSPIAFSWETVETWLEHRQCEWTDELVE